MFKKIGKKIYAIVAILLVLSISFASVSLNIFSKANKNSSSEVTGVGDNDYSTIERDTFISVNNDVLQIDRTQKEYSIMGNEDTWSLYIYMTGSNLETYYENATKDISEMFDSKVNSDNIEKVNIFIQTGGSNTWHSNNISNKHVQRYKFNAYTKELTLVEELGNENMGNAIRVMSKCIKNKR